MRGGLPETDKETCFLENTNPKGALQHVSPALIIPQHLFSLPTALTYSAALGVDKGVEGQNSITRYQYFATATVPDCPWTPLLSPPGQIKLT